MVDLIYTVLGLSLVAAAFFGLYYEKKAKIGAVPTLPPVADKMLALAQQYVATDRPLRIAELGCGWGGLLLRAAHHFPTAAIHGYEMFFLPRWVTQLRCLGQQRISISGDDFFAQNLSDYDLLFCYLSPQLMSALQEKSQRELRPGTIIVSNAFAMPDFVPIATATVAFVGQKIDVYVYRW
jgi:hypothetical protein